jgi:hypothetical protein
MGQHVADIDFTAVEMDGGDEAVLVAANVEHDKVADFVRRWKGSPYCLKARKVLPLHDFEPPNQRTFAVGVLFPKLAQRFARDNVHAARVSHNEMACNMQ